MGRADTNLFAFLQFFRFCRQNAASAMSESYGKAAVGSGEAAASALQRRQVPAASLLLGDVQLTA